MPRYRVRYIDNVRGDSLREWEGETEDEGDALDQAMLDDYYFGKYIDTEEIDD